MLLCRRIKIPFTVYLTSQRLRLDQAFVPTSTTSTLQHYRYKVHKCRWERIHIDMESKAAKPPEVYLVGDSPDCLDRFKLTLYNAWRIDAKCLNRKDFDNLSDSDVGKGKVIFVIPHSPRVIIYDESHPTRSFHKQINRAETLQGQRGGTVVYMTWQ